MTATNGSLWAFLFTAVCSPLALSAEAPEVPSPPKVAYVHGGKLYYFQVKDRAAGFHRGPRKPDELWHAKLNLEGPFKKEKQLAPCLGIARDRLPDRWRISHDFFWWEIDQIGLGAGSNHEASLWRVPLGKVSVQFDALGDSMTFGLKHCCSLEPIIVLRDSPADDNSFDVIPGSKDEIHVLLAWRGEVRVWRGVWSWYDVNEVRDSKGEKSWVPPKFWPKKMPYIKWDNEIPRKEDELLHDARPVMRVRTDMREGFFAYQDKTHFFFVTISGKLYACRKRGENQRTEHLWTDAESPICAIIHDTASQKTFAFTKAVGRGDKAGRNVCFELAPKLDPFTYDAKKIPALKQDDPLTTVMEYSRILLREKKIKLDDEKRPPKRP